MELSVDGLLHLFGHITLAFKHWQFGNKKQLGFLEDFYVLINDGIPANRAIDMMVEVTQGLTREVALHISQKISEGAPLADGMRDWFSPSITEIIRVGEAGGALAQTVQSAIKALSQRNVALGSFIGAIAYPSLVILMGCAMTVYLNTSVFDQFRALKPENEWPAAGQRLVEIAYLVQDWWWAFILVLAILIFTLRRLLSDYTGSLRHALDEYPPFSLYRRLIAAQFLETLGLLVNNGIVFKSALRVMQYRANPYLASHLAEMEHLLSTGKTNIADVLSTGLIDEKDLMRLRVMAEVKGLEHGLIRMGIRGAEETVATLKLISRVIGGIMLAVGGLLVLSIFQGIYLTAMSLGTT